MSELATWGTFSNISSQINNVTLYDSVTRLRYIPDEKRVSYDVSLDSYAYYRNSCPRDSLFIDVARVDPVNKNSMSGVAAIFHALCLSRGIDPSIVTFDYSALKRNLVDTFQRQSFDGINLQSTPGTRSKILFAWEVPLYCHCKMPFISEPLTECSGCNNCFHDRCESDALKVERGCVKVCRNKLKKRTNSTARRGDSYQDDSN